MCKSMFFISISLCLCSFNLAQYNLSYGSFAAPIRIDFSISARNFIGDIITMKDNAGNYFNISVINYDRNIKIMVFGDASQTKSLIQFCGCKDCGFRNVTMYLYFNEKLISAGCNGAGAIVFHSLNVLTNIATINFGGNSYKNGQTHQHLTGCIRSLLINEQLIKVTTRDNSENQYLDECSPISTPKSVSTSYVKRKTPTPTKTVSTSYVKMKTPTHIPISTPKTVSTSYVKMKTSTHTISTSVYYSTMPQKSTNPKMHTVTSSKFEKSSTNSIVPASNYFECISYKGAYHTWMMVSVFELMVIFILVIFMNKVRLDVFIQKMKNKIENIEVPIHESIQNRNTLSVYSSINEIVIQNVIQAPPMSNDSYMVPQTLSVSDVKPVVPPRGENTIFRRNEKNERLLLTSILTNSLRESIFESDETYIDLSDTSASKDGPSLPPRDQVTIYRRNECSQTLNERLLSPLILSSSLRESILESDETYTELSDAKDGPFLSLRDKSH